MRASDATVVIVTYNSADVVDDCLNSLRVLRKAPAEVVVIDNASRDHSAQVVAQRHPWVRLIRQPRNLGFGGACNLGLAMARTAFTVLLNPDTQVETDWLEALGAALAIDPRIGIAGSKILELDGRTVQHLGGIVHGNGLTDHVGRGQLDTPAVAGADAVVDCDYVTGASMALRREMLRHIGGFDSGFFPAYFEETDLCWRARKGGWRVVVAQASRLRHIESAASGRMSGDFLQRYHRNRVRFVLKNYSLRELCQRFWPAERDWIRSGNAAESLPAIRLAWRRAALTLPAILWSRIRGGPRLPLQP